MEKNKRRPADLVLSLQFASINGSIFVLLESWSQNDFNSVPKQKLIEAFSQALTDILSKDGTPNPQLFELFIESLLQQD
jgi:hypothetical protein